MGASPKITAASVGAAATTVVTSIVSAHLFKGNVPADVLALIQAGVTAGVTYASGYLTRHVPAPVIKDAETVVKDVADMARNDVPLATVLAPQPVVPNPTGH